MVTRNKQNCSLTVFANIMLYCKHSVASRSLYISLQLRLGHNNEASRCCNICM